MLGVVKQDGPDGRGHPPPPMFKPFALVLVKLDRVIDAMPDAARLAFSASRESFAGLAVSAATVTNQ